MGVLDGGSLPSRSALRDRGVDHVRGGDRAALKAREHKRAVRRGQGARGIGNAVCLTDQQFRPAELSPEYDSLRHYVEADGEDAQRTGRSGKLDSARRYGEARLVIPHHDGCSRGEPPPAENFLVRDIAASKTGRRPLEDRRRRGAAVRERERESVQQKIRWTRVARRSRRGQHFAGYVVQAASARQPARE